MGFIAVELWIDYFADVNNDSRHVVPQNEGETCAAINSAFMWVSGHRGYGMRCPI